LQKDAGEVAERARGSIEASTTGALQKAQEIGTKLVAESLTVRGETGHSTPASKASDKLLVIQQVAETYTSDPSDAAAYASFLRSFDAQLFTDKVEILLRDEPAVAKMHAWLVPEQVPYQLFWARYFFHAGKVEEEEERKRKMLSKAVFDDDDDFTWDEDDAAASTSPSAVPASSPKDTTSELGSNILRSSAASLPTLTVSSDQRHRVALETSLDVAGDASTSHAAPSTEVERPPKLAVARAAPEPAATSHPSQASSTEAARKKGEHGGSSKGTTEERETAAGNLDDSVEGKTGASSVNDDWDDWE